MWSCNSPVKIGNDEASCITSYDSLCQLAAAGCPTGKTQDLSKVPACISDTANATCAEYNAGSYRAANCDAVKCK